MRIDAERFFGYCIFHPTDKRLSPTQKSCSLAGSIALGVLTFGIVHAICYACLHNRVKRSLNGNQKPTARVGAQIFKKNNQRFNGRHQNQVGRKHQNRVGRGHQNQVGGGYKNHLNEKAHWVKILNNLPNQDKNWVKHVKQFLLNKNFKYNDKTFDQGFEDTFDVAYLDSKTCHEDGDFLKYLHKTYPKEIAGALNSPGRWSNHNQFKDGQCRFANTEIAALFSLSKQNPRYLMMLREIFLYEVYRVNKH